MSHNVGFEILETLQASHINRHPDPDRDINPSTTASKKSPVRLRSQQRRSSSSSGHVADAASSSNDEIPTSILDPQPRKTNLPPLPDLRFEQSYLARIEPYVSTGRYGMVAWYTVWDHVFMPLTQALVWRVVVFGWRNFNTGVKFQGHGVGARIRRWWWTVNGWVMPEGQTTSRAANAKTRGLGADALRMGRTRDDSQEFFVGLSGNGGD